MIDLLEIRARVNDVIRALAALRPYEQEVASLLREAVTGASSTFKVSPGTYRVRLTVAEIAGVQTNCALRFGPDAFAAFPKTGGYSSGAVILITGKEHALIRIENITREPQSITAITDGAADVLAWVRIL